MLFRDMEAQKHNLVMTKGKKKKTIWIQGQLRLLPFGIVEYVFPKEDRDMVLTTFEAEKNYYDYVIPNIFLIPLRKILKLKKIPKYKKDKKLLWVKEHVNIIPLGIREDAEIEDTSPNLEGWKHEAI
jgi:hypothetical protein